jgi:secreted trypsin-like serine protease
MAADDEGSASDAADQQDILECIKHAQEKAGQDDRAFVRYLNDCYATKLQAPERRTRGVAVRAVTAPVDRSPRAQQLMNDPRYLKNARELARRTQGGTRVIGGTPVPRRDFLDCVAVGNDQQFGCTGTLIAPNVVVSAGHCSGFATRVFFGSDVSKPGRTVRVGDRHRHPDYRKNGLQNDLLVLVLEERVENIPSRAIAGKAAVDSATDGRVVGFGNTDPLGSAGYGIKRQVDVPIASASCQGTFDGEPDSVAYGCDVGLELVAGKPLLAKDSCTGDSGGPFYIETPGGWLIAGATSRATNSAPNDCGDGGIYVRIERYLPWIRSLPGVTIP